MPMSWVGSSFEDHVDEPLSSMIVEMKRVYEEGFRMNDVAKENKIGRIQSSYLHTVNFPRDFVFLSGFIGKI